jgi:hypothetical protein
MLNLPMPWDELEAGDKGRFRKIIKEKGGKPNNPKGIIVERNAIRNHRFSFNSVSGTDG